jgi:hypothetical protein
MIEIDDHFDYVLASQGHNKVPKQITVKYVNDKSMSDRIYPATSAELKPLGTKTYDEGWRLTLKVGDEIDAYD